MNGSSLASLTAPLVALSAFAAGPDSPSSCALSHSSVSLMAVSFIITLPAVQLPGTAVKNVRTLSSVAEQSLIEDGLSNHAHVNAPVTSLFACTSASSIAQYTASSG